MFSSSRTTVFPILGGGERLGTLVLGRVKDDFNENDLVLGEYAATVEWKYFVRNIMKLRKRHVINGNHYGTNSLSYSEKAIEHILKN